MSGVKVEFNVSRAVITLCCAIHQNAALGNSAGWCNANGTGMVGYLVDVTAYRNGLRLHIVENNGPVKYCYWKVSAAVADAVAAWWHDVNYAAIVDGVVMKGNLSGPWVAMTERGLNRVVNLLTRSVGKHLKAFTYTQRGTWGDAEITYNLMN